MCGIFAYFGNSYSNQKCIEYAQKIKHRGPDNSKAICIDDKVLLVFHRLEINGLNDISNQPFCLNGVYLICNGEIYNFKNLIQKYELEDKYFSNSDCEIILHLYNLIGIEEMCKEIDGEFAFVIYDTNEDKLIIARDHLGIRSLYVGKDDVKGLFVASEMKAIPEEYSENVFQMIPGHYVSYDVKDEKPTFSEKSVKFSKLFVPFTHMNESEVIEDIQDIFSDAVYKRLMSDRNIACLLSGGLDSTTIVALLARKFKPFTLNTYSIGFKGSEDLHFAQIAANYLKTNHTSIELEPQDFLNAIEKTIYQIESYDTTTVRASVGNYLVSLYIRDHSSDVVLFCGDVSDELFGSYRGFFDATSDLSFYAENIKLIENIHFFDVLRSDKSISGAGLEARVPFSDKLFVECIMRLPPSVKRFNTSKPEKYIFRKAFEKLLPPELCWRKKTAFSDGVSSKEKPWYKLIQENLERVYNDEMFNKLSQKYVHNTPYDKESLYYREIFEKYYPNRGHTIPYFWRQPFSEEEDPSAWHLESTQLSK